MDVPFLQSINGHWKQLKKWTLQKVSSAPVDSVEGGVWYNETSKRIEVDIGSENKEVAYVGESAEHNSLLDKDGGDTINNYYGHVKQIHNNILDNFGKASGAIVSDSNNFIPIEQIPVGLLGGLTPKGAWNPSTNTPSLSNPPLATTRGWFYISSTSGTALGTDWASGDWCISDGTVWQKIDNTDKVSSVFGRTGSVVAASGDYNLDQINEGTTYKRITSTEKTNYNTAYTHSQSTGNSHSIVASQIPSTATGGISATNIQSAIAELDSEKLSTSSAANEYVSKTTTASQSISSELVTKKSIYNHRTAGTGGVSGHFKVCTITITNIYTNRPLEFTITQRSKKDSAKVSILFTNDSGLNPSIASFTYDSLSTYGIYAYRSATSIWEIYATTGESYDDLEVSEFHDVQGKFPDIVWETSQVSAVPSGSIQATLAEFLNNTTGNAATATALTTTNIGDVNTPVYFSGGKPVVCTSLDLNTTGNAASATRLNANYWQGTYVGSTYNYIKIISIATNDLNDHGGYETHSIFVGKSFYGEQHHMQGVLNIGMGGAGSASVPALSFIGQSRNMRLVYTFNDTTNLLDVYMYIISGEYSGMIQGIVTNIITSTRPSAITLLSSGSQLLSVSGAIDVGYFSMNPLDKNTATNGNLVVGGGSTLTGSAHMGNWVSNPTAARFGHADHNTNGGFGFVQTSDGGVNLSAPTGSLISFQINNVQKNYMDASGYFHFQKPSTSDNTDTVPTTAWVKDVAAPISHAHGNITNAGAIGTTSGLPVVTTTSGVLATAAWSTDTPNMDGTASVGSSTVPSRSDHRHPTDTSRLAIGSGLSAGATVILRQYNSSNPYTNNVIYLEY